MAEKHISPICVEIMVIGLAIDPVCKMLVDERTAEYKSKYRGKEYYFCSLGCKKEFDVSPEKYV